MGNKFVKSVVNSQSITFQGAGSVHSNRDYAKYLFNNDLAGETPEDRYDYFDGLITENPEIQAVLKEHQIEWPGSYEDMNEG
jgi:hypothetical protein